MKRLGNAIRGTRKTLENELEDIKHIQSVASTIAKILGGISEIQGKLKGLVNQG